VLVGIADHLGWAVAVTARADGRVVDRRRVELVEDGMPCMPVHHGIESLDDDAASALLASVRASAVRATAAALDELAALGAIDGICLRSSPDDFPTALADLRRSPWEARADAVMYREVLASAAAARGWAVHRYEAKTAEAEVAQRFGDVRSHELLHGPKATLGSPWAKDHRVALAAVLLAGGA
jgi:hypothetical protein